MPREAGECESSPRRDAAIADAIVTQRSAVERGLRRTCGASEAEAEDAVSEAVARLWRRRGRLQDSDPLSVRAWLRRTAHRVFFREHRRATSRATEALEEWADLLASSAPGPWDERQMEVALANDWWRQALERLPSGRRIVLLRWHSGESPKQIAAELQVPASRLRVQIHRDYHRSLELARNLGDEPVHGQFSMDRVRIERIAEIAGVVSRWVRHVALECDWPNAAEHRAWLALATDEEIAAWVVALLAEPEGTDELD